LIDLARGLPTYQFYCAACALRTEQNLSGMGAWLEWLRVVRAQMELGT